jgi:hypothetical protein
MSLTFPAESRAARDRLLEKEKEINLQENLVSSAPVRQLTA